MRIELSGSLVRPEPLVLRFTADQDFDTLSYTDLGYTHFEAICIGAGGGPGGGIDTANTGTFIRSYGGAGGGGGFHRVRGVLSALPALCPIVVGVGGNPGDDHDSDPALTTDGADGGFSTFNTTSCRASGGEGGKHVESNSDLVSTDADGGDGGVGNRTTVGGGASGGLAGTPSPTGPGDLGTNGSDGTLTRDIGKGGGGGAGGVGTYDGDLTLNPATAGGRGSYNPSNLSVYGPGALPTSDPDSGSASIIPGGASGAKAAPLNGLPVVYGASKNALPGSAGIVVIRLTAE